MQQLAQHVVGGFVTLTSTSLFGMALQLPQNVFVRLCFLNDAINSIRTMHRMWTLQDRWPGTHLDPPEVVIAKAIAASIRLGVGDRPIRYRGTGWDFAHNKFFDAKNVPEYDRVTHVQ